MTCPSPKTRTSSDGRADLDPGDARLPTGPAEWIGCMRALEEERIRLQALVCELLRENEKLRAQRTESLAAPHNQ